MPKPLPDDRQIFKLVISAILAHALIARAPTGAEVSEVAETAAKMSEDILKANGV